MRGEKRTEFLSFPAKSDHRFAFTTPSRYSLLGLVNSGTRAESLSYTVREVAADSRDLGWEVQAVVVTLLVFSFPIY